VAEARELPILFSGPMVRALLREENPKSQTRRVIKPQPDHRFVRFVQISPGNDQWGPAWANDADGIDIALPVAPHTVWECPRPIGTRLWVKETFWVSDCGKFYAVGTGIRTDVLSVDGQRRWLYGRYEPTGFDDTDRRYTHPESPHMVGYWGVYGKRGFKLGFSDMDVNIRIVGGTGNAIIKDYTATFTRQKSSTQMPRWASRINLEVTDVRVQRVQEISEADAIAEGFGGQEPYDVAIYEETKSYPIAQFAHYWDELNFKRGHGWNLNDWVFAYTFKRLEAPHA